MEKGIKIMRLEAADIIAEMEDKRYICKNYNAVLDNSDMLDKLIEIGLKVSKSGTTRDIISLKFNYTYKSTSYKELNKKLDIKKEEIKPLKEDYKRLKDIFNCIILEKNNAKKSANKEQTKLINQEIKEVKKQFEEDTKEYVRFRDIIKELNTNMKEQHSLNREEVRIKLYEEGFNLTFSKGDKSETIEYVYFFRSSSKARVGECLFINKKLAKKITKWLELGIELDDNNAKVVEMEAYKALISSSKIGNIKLDASKEILVINDLTSYSNSLKIAEVNTKIEDNNNICVVNRKIGTVKNILFDGQALLDVSVFKENGYANNSFMTLRNRMFKCCAFNSNIQSFMRDYFGDDYETAIITDKYNRQLFAKDIKLITTENAMKWEKFNFSMEKWVNAIAEEGNKFSICKVDHQSKYGNKQRTSYQHLNSLNFNADEVRELCKENIEYVNKLKNDENEFKNFLKLTATEVNQHEMCLSLLEHNNKFKDTSYFKKYKSKTISEYKKEIQSGKLLFEAENLTVVGNPYVMLLHSVNALDKYIKNNVLENFEDVTLPVSDKYISVYTKRFEEGEELASFRNPHNSPCNVGYNVNFRHELMDKYFNFNNSVMAVNLIKTEEQDLKNSEDQDGDFNYVTNNKLIVSKAKYLFRNYPVIVNNVPLSKKSYNNTMLDRAKIDHVLAKGKLNIGESSNLSQIALSFYFGIEKTEELEDVFIINSVLAQIAIDSAKREFKIDVKKEVNRLRNLKSMQKNGVSFKPAFWKYIDYKKDEDELKLIETNCTMDLIVRELENINNSNRKANIQLSSLLVKEPSDYNVDKYNKAIKLIKLVDDKVREAHDNKDENFNKEDWLKTELRLYKECLSKLDELKLDKNTVHKIIVYAIKDGTKLCNKVLGFMYKTRKNTFIKCFKPYKNA